MHCDLLFFKIHFLSSLSSLASIPFLSFFLGRFKEKTLLHNFTVLQARLAVLAACRLRWIGKPSGFCALLVTYSRCRCDEFHAPALCDSLDPLRSALFVVVHLVLVLVHIILPPRVPPLPTNLATAPGIEASFCSCSQFPWSQSLRKPATFAASVFQ